jgi:hypothetical protein
MGSLVAFEGSSPYQVLVLSVPGLGRYSPRLGISSTKAWYDLLIRVFISLQNTKRGSVKTFI